MPLVIGLGRPNGAVSRFETRVFAADHPRAAENLRHVERIVKFLLWQKGGARVWIGGPRPVGEHIAATYAPGGAREFDARFMGDEVYREPFRVEVCDAADVPAANEVSQPLGRHLEGCRIG